MEKNKVETIKTRKVAILLEDGYDYKDVMQVKQALKAAGATAEVISKFLGKRKAATGEEIEADKSHVTTASIMYDAVFIPEGEKSIAAMLKAGDAIHFINEAFKHCKPIATSGSGIALLQKADVPGIKFTEPGSGKIVTDKGVVTAGSDAEAADFAAQFLDAIKKHRFWDREEKDMVPA